MSSNSFTAPNSSNRRVGVKFLTLPNAINDTYTKLSETAKRPLFQLPDSLIHKQNGLSTFLSDAQALQAVREYLGRKLNQDAELLTDLKDRNGLPVDWARSAVHRFHANHQSLQDVLSSVRIDGSNSNLQSSGWWPLSADTGTSSQGARSVLGEGVHEYYTLCVPEGSTVQQKMEAMDRLSIKLVQSQKGNYIRPVTIIPLDQDIAKVYDLDFIDGLEDLDPTERTLHSYANPTNGPRLLYTGYHSSEADYAQVSTAFKEMVAASSTNMGLYNRLVPSIPSLVRSGVQFMDRTLVKPISSGLSWLGIPTSGNSISAWEYLSEGPRSFQSKVQESSPTFVAPDSVYTSPTYTEAFEACQGILGRAVALGEMQMDKVERDKRKGKGKKD